MLNAISGDNLRCLRTPTSFDPFEPGFRDDPYEAYSHWRNVDPVHWGCAPDQAGPGCWYVFGYAEAKLVLTDDRFCADPRTAIPTEYLPPPVPEQAALAEMLRGWFIFRDPPDHARLRQGVMKAFAAGTLHLLQPEIDRLAGRLVRQLMEKHRADLIADLALPLPVAIIGRILGLPDADGPKLAAWSRAWLAGFDFADAHTGAAARARGAEAVGEFVAYMDRHIARLNAEGGSGLVAELLRASGHSGSARDEIIATTALLIFAGHETTARLIGNGLEALLRHPSQLARLREEPALLETAVEECARYNSPSQITFRFATEPVELGGKQLTAGSPVGVVIGSANRDEKVFEDPERFDISRRSNPHLSYGRGRHACIGAALARREALAAIGTLVAACPRLERVADIIEWGPTVGLRGLRTLEVLVDHEGEPFGTSAAAAR